MTSERQARMGLCAVAEPGSVRVGALVQQFGAVDVWEGLRRRNGTGISERAKALDLAVIERDTERCGARFLIPGDQAWPRQLEGLGSVEHNGQGGPPLGLWVRGELAVVPLGGVAIVGSRAASSYGRSAAHALAYEVAQRGRVVISGGAFGIDAEAHRGALGAAGPTVCVLASSVDEPYPRVNAGLFDQIAERGLVVSESPPGSHPTRPRFLARNRLIAALASATVIVEGAARSGACNTMTWTTLLNRVAMAVPGPIESSLSISPHRYIREHIAELVTNGDEIESLLAPIGQAMIVDMGGPARPLDALTAAQSVVFEAIPRRGSCSTEELAALADLPWRETVTVLGELTDAGWVAERSDGTYGLGRRRAG